MYEMFVRGHENRVVCDAHLPCADMRDKLFAVEWLPSGFIDSTLLLLPSSPSELIISALDWTLGEVQGTPTTSFPTIQEPRSIEVICTANVTKWLELL